jgi:hypothetical protein
LKSLEKKAIYFSFPDPRRKAPEGGIMPGSMDKPSTGKEKWVHFKLYTPPELAEACRA